MLPVMPNPCTAEPETSQKPGVTSNLETTATPAEPVSSWPLWKRVYLCRQVSSVTWSLWKSWCCIWVLEWWSSRHMARWVPKSFCWPSADNKHWNCRICQFNSVATLLGTLLYTSYLYLTYLKLYYLYTGKRVMGLLQYIHLLSFCIVLAI